MALWPAPSLGLSQVAGSDTSTSAATTATSGGAAHTKGSWAQLIAATDFDADGMWLRLQTSRGGSGFATPGLVDVGVGGSGSEVVAVADLFYGFDDGGAMGYWLPLTIARGSRVSLRWQTLQTSVNAVFSAVLVRGGMQTSPLATTYGANTTVSGGVNLPTVGSSNTKSTWQAITTSTTVPTRFLVPMVMPDPLDAAITANVDILVDLAVGGAGAEVPFINNLPLAATNNEQLRCPKVTVPVNIPVGTRIAARHQKSVNANIEPPSVAVVCFS